MDKSNIERMNMQVLNPRDFRKPLSKEGKDGKEGKDDICALPEQSIWG